MAMNTRHTFRWSTWLGWQLESNWTEAWLFIVYVLLKPLTSSMLLVCMYYAVRELPLAESGTRVPVQFLPYMYVSNACYLLIGAIMFGMSYAVISDREHYRMLKYIYISPAHLKTYFIGRAVSGGAQALLGGLINLLIGAIAFPEVRRALVDHPTEWLWLLGYLLLGTVLLIALGLILSAIVLNMARQGMYLSEGISGLFYLVCGVVFPISILPGWLQAVSLSLPPTYWLEGMRRSILGHLDGQVPSPLSSWSHFDLTLALLISTVIFSAFSLWFFRWSERRAWMKGRLEETTGA
jgi:ABC-2 type transport system permease protein